MPGLIVLVHEAVEALKSVQRLAGLHAALTLDDPASGLLKYAEDTAHAVLRDGANNVANRTRRIREECDVPESATRSLARMMTRDVFEQRLEEMIQRIDAKDARRAIRGTEFFSIDENVMGSEFMRAYENILLTGYIRGWLTATEAVGGKRRKQ